MIKGSKWVFPLHPQEYYVFAERSENYIIFNRPGSKLPYTYGVEVLDMIKPYVEPILKDSWININKSDVVNLDVRGNAYTTVRIFNSEEYAERHREHDFVKCIKV